MVARAKNHTSVVGIANGIGDQILQHGTQQVAVRQNPYRGWHRDQFHALGLGHRGELAVYVAEQLAQGQRCDSGLNATGFQLGQVQQGRQQMVRALD